jgi:hypothetical protein
VSRRPKGSPDEMRILLFRACFGANPVNGVLVTDCHRLSPTRRVPIGPRSPTVWDLTGTLSRTSSRKCFSSDEKTDFFDSVGA